ncbi:MAG: sugar phosphate isomerase/epimerase, partial [Desulfobacterales bacterium]|nr:sugar phosphate isomerase/epimerase [Deltaproteobacteria bacterium]NNL41826.1 sugar phosphate isomerase/epimerase [Desulfobacterales bacterium]
MPKSYKGAYPFKLGTTSFIYQDDYIPNVKMLGPYIDEIELLLFESKPSSLPNKKEIDELSLLSKEFDLSYNIHLPIDIS